MLKYRLLTAILLLPILLLLIFFLPTVWFSIFISCIVSVMMSEWLMLANIRNILLISLGCLIIFIISFVVNYFIFFSIPVRSLLIINLMIWLLLGFFLIQYEKTQNLSIKTRSFKRIISYPWVQIGIGFYLLLNYAISILILLQLSPRPWWLLFGILMVWAADVGAYTVGRLYGKQAKLLAPLISPKKTWIGLWGGLIAGFILALLFCIWIPMNEEQRISVIFSSPIIILFSILGDLFESFMKRNAGVKDSGSLLPGHGGFLDRLDSTMAALPILALILLFLK